MKKIILCAVLATASLSSYAQYSSATTGVASVAVGAIMSGAGLFGNLSWFNIDKKNLINDCLNFYSLNEISEDLADVIDQARMSEEAKNLSDEQIVRRLVQQLIKED